MIQCKAGLDRSLWPTWASSAFGMALACPFFKKGGNVLQDVQVCKPWIHPRCFEAVCLPEDGVRYSEVMFGAEPHGEGSTGAARAESFLSNNSCSLPTLALKSPSRKSLLRSGSQECGRGNVLFVRI